ncbi:winged helix-turn-helix domain-containing protein [Rhodovastum atsumiense]|nr:winged helix-turn-helix domain-containing protein [Rhodovastum atsumiense]
MARPLLLRSDSDAVSVRAAARAAKDGGQARRFLALVAICEGSAEAAKIGEVTPQIVRDWVMTFNAAGPAGLIDPGGARCGALAANRPVSVGLGRIQISVSRQTMSRQLRAMGLRKLSVRPRHHAQAEEAIEHFQKVSRLVWRKSPPRRVSPLNE